MQTTFSQAREGTREQKIAFIAGLCGPFESRIHSVLTEASNADPLALDGLLTRVGSLMGHYSGHELWARIHGIIGLDVGTGFPTASALQDSVSPMPSSWFTHTVPTANHLKFIGA